MKIARLQLIGISQADHKPILVLQLQHNLLGLLYVNICKYRFVNIFPTADQTDLTMLMILRINNFSLPKRIKLEIVQAANGRIGT